MLTYVVPKVVGVFANIGAELPLLTRSLIATSDFLTGNWYWLVLVIGAIIFFTHRWLQNPAARSRYHRFLLRLPLIGRLTRGINTARFARTLAILAGSASYIAAPAAIRMALPEVDAGMLNEVQAGSFLLMDTAYRDAGVEFENALSCPSTVISRPTPARAATPSHQHPRPAPKTPRQR